MKKILGFSMLSFFLCCILVGYTFADEWIKNPTNGHLYKYVHNCGHWQDCENAALGEGAHLVTINDAQEQAWKSKPLDGLTGIPG